jgi:membrane-associated phospholipid phosphatase
MVAYGILAVLVSRSFLPRTTQLVVFGAVVALVFLIGLSRVWLGVHYPSDVIAGWVAGATVVLVYASFTRGVSREPAEAAVAADRAAPRSDRSAAG